MFSTFIYKTGVRYIAVSAFLSLLSAVISFSFLAYLFAGISLFLVWFFRNPQRNILPYSGKQIISPADGVVIKVIKDAVAPAGYEHINQKWQQVSVFMRVYDVHVNRAPISGIVKKVIHTPGNFKYAAADQADTDNERVSVLFEGEITVICQQVAGMLARRILCHVSPNDKIDAGDIYGFIQLGSRADLFFPADLEICVKKGDKVKAGLSYIVK